MDSIKWRIGVVAGTLAMPFTAHPTVAQQAELVLSGGRLVDARGLEQSGIAVSPAVFWSGEAGELLARGGVTLTAGAEALWSGGVAGAVRAGGIGPLMVEVAGGGEMGIAHGWRGLAGRVAPRVVFSGGGWTAAAGPVWGVATEQLGSDEAGGLVPGLGPEVERSSRTRQYGGISAEAGWVGLVGSIAARGSRIESESARWQELSVGGRAEILGAVWGVEGGVRVGDEVGRWAGASVAVPLGTAAALLLEGGRYPPDPLLGRPDGRYATVGLRFRID